MIRLRMMWLQKDVFYVMRKASRALKKGYRTIYLGPRLKEIDLPGYTKIELHDLFVYYKRVPRSANHEEIGIIKKKENLSDKSGIAWLKFIEGALYQVSRNGVTRVAGGISLGEYNKSKELLATIRELTANEKVG